MSDGTTAIQVSPADLASVRDLVSKVSAIIASVEDQQDRIRDLEYELRLSCDRYDQCTKDRDDLSNRLSLAETQLAGEHDLNSRLTKINEEKDAENIQLLSELNQTRRDRDDVAFKHLEVSEELAQANSTLGKFRELLGIPAVGVSASPNKEQVTAPPAANEYVAEGASPFPSPAPIVNDGQSPAQESEHGSSDHSLDPYKQAW